MMQPGRYTLIAVLAMFWIGVQPRVTGDGAASTVAADAQDSASGDKRLALPATIDRALKSEIEAATTGAALEAVLARHPDQGQILVPRIEAVTAAEIRREGPRERFVIPGLEPDPGPGNTVTLEAAGGRMTLKTEFPGDAARVNFSDGSIHRFVGEFPFADVLSLVGEGDANHRLTFVVIEDVMVYVRGTGRALMGVGGKDGTVRLGAAGGSSGPGSPR